MKTLKPILILFMLTAFFSCECDLEREKRLAKYSTTYTIEVHFLNGKTDTMIAIDPLLEKIRHQNITCLYDRDCKLIASNVTHFKILKRWK